MAWLEITIDTAAEKINSVVTVLTAKGFADLVIEPGGIRDLSGGKQGLLGLY